MSFVTIEIVGGLALILGFGTRIVFALMAIILLVATFKVKLAVGFFEMVKCRESS